MTIAYCDTIGGIAGDMTMAAFISAGVPVEFLGAELAKLPLEGFELAASHVRRSAIDAVHIDVVVTGTATYHRHLKDILAIVEGSTLPGRVKERASSIFRVVAAAEAKIHNVPVEKVHFHEVGAVDSIVDIVGACVCLEYFGVERLYSSAVRLGSGGFINAEHGRMPTPTPATLEILKNYPSVLTSVPHELTTPTGAAIIKALSSGLLDDEQIVVQAVGYGAGTKEFPELPNLLRVIVGELRTPEEQEEIIVVETNIDDMNPQVYPFLIDRLLASGAHDAYLVPIIMKKGRPGVLLSVMADASRLEEVTALIYRHTSTIGLRIHRVGRRKLPRRAVEITTSFGPVRAKAVLRDGREVLTAEYEECRRIAETTGLSILDVMKQLDKEAGSA